MPICGKERLGSDPAAQRRVSRPSALARGLTPIWSEANSEMSGINDFVVKFATVNGSGSASRQHHLRQDAVPDGHPGQPEEHLSLQHPGPADLVRGAGVGGRLSGAARRHRPDGRHEPAELQGGPGRDRARRLAALRFDAAAHLAARRHHRAGRADRRDVRRALEGPAPAPAVQEHGLRRRADGAARHRPRGAERRGRRPAQGQGEAGRRQHGGGRARARVRAASISTARCRSRCAMPSAPRARSW